MKTWRTVDSEIKSIGETEKKIIDLKVELVSQLINERKNKGLSQRDLSKKTGIKQSAIARMESNGVFPKIEMLATVAGVLGLEVKLIRTE